MHYHLEIIMPPVPLDQIESMVAHVMKTFDEGYSDTEYYGGDGRNPHAFWDWYVIGGRWSGHKDEALLDPEKKAEFDKKLEEMKLTVSAVQVGKQELKPASQAAKVDELWRGYFPASRFKQCPYFAHSGNQYENSIERDTMRLGETPLDMEADRVMITDLAGDVQFMIETQYYNGVSFNDSGWDGKLRSALDQYAKKTEHYKDEWVQKNKPTAEWFVVTVDYHN